MEAANKHAEKRGQERKGKIVKRVKRGIEVLLAAVAQEKQRQQKKKKKREKERKKEKRKRKERKCLEKFKKKL